MGVVTERQLGHTITSKDQLHGEAAGGHEEPGAGHALHPRNAHHDAPHEHVDEDNVPLPSSGPEKPAADASASPVPTRACASSPHPCGGCGCLWVVVGRLCGWLRGA